MGQFIAAPPFKPRPTHRNVNFLITTCHEETRQLHDSDFHFIAAFRIAPFLEISKKFFHKKTFSLDFDYFSLSLDRDASKTIDRPLNSNEWCCCFRTVTNSTGVYVLRPILFRDTDRSNATFDLNPQIFFPRLSLPRSIFVLFERLEIKTNRKQVERNDFKRILIHQSMFRQEFQDKSSHLIIINEN